MKSYSSIIVLGLLLLFIQSCEQSEDVDIDVNAAILEEMEAQRIPSVVACVVKGNEIVWEETFGLANVAEGKAATRLTLYSLQSISKLFLATTVMQLWERGLIDLEADINQYLPFEVRNPRFPDHAITPYMLLTHRSSLAWPLPGELGDFEYFFTHEEVPLISEWLPQWILPGGERYYPQVWKEYAPGEQWLYSNIGTSLLALIVEQISGEDYRDFCRKNILEPLDMHNSGFRLSNLDPELVATGYYENNHPIHQFVYRHYPIADLKSNIEDFSHFMIAFLNYGEYKGKRILERSTVEKMFELQNPASGVALIWWWGCLGECIGHSGGGTGWRSYAGWHHASDKGLFIFSNKKKDAVAPGGRIYELVRYQFDNY